MITTGAGLSMMLIDELAARGMKPLNFCDIRTGQMRGSPARVMRVLDWITSRPSLRAVLVNVFAGITDLAEFGGLLATGIEQTPGLRVPVVARLVGRGAPEARRILAERHPAVFVTEDLEEALRRVGSVIGAAPSPQPPPRKGRGEYLQPPQLQPQDSPSPCGRGWGRGPSHPFQHHARHHAGHHRPDGPNACPVDARLRHQHRGGTSTHGRAESVSLRPGCSPPATRPCRRPVRSPRRDDAAPGDVGRGRGGGGCRDPADRHCRRRHPAARRSDDRPLTLRRAGATWIGASTPGMAIAARDEDRASSRHLARPGAVAMMSKSGTLSYEGAAPPRAGRHGPEYLDRRGRRPGEGRALRGSAAELFADRTPTP